MRLTFHQNRAYDLGAMSVSPKSTTSLIIEPTVQPIVERCTTCSGPGVPPGTQRCYAHVVNGYVSVVGARRMLNASWCLFTWFKTTDTVATARGIIGSLGTSGVRMGIYLPNTTPGDIRTLANFGGSTHISPDTGLTINDNQWHFAVANFNRTGNADLYVDDMATPASQVDISGSSGLNNSLTNDDNVGRYVGTGDINEGFFYHCGKVEQWLPDATQRNQLKAGSKPSELGAANTYWYMPFSENLTDVESDSFSFSTNPVNAAWECG